MKSVAPEWHLDTVQRHAAPPVFDLLSTFGLHQFTHFPAASELNTLAQAIHAHWSGPAFLAQSDISPQEQRYYEAIIAEDNSVPTRENSWHDLFNALVWMQFPHTKRALNQWHMQDILAHGVHPRTPRRNRITHFDECGVVLAVPASKKEEATKVLEALATHNWERAFISCKSYWHNSVIPLVFGHANLEMMLTPFNGLTGKWLAVVVDIATDVPQCDLWQAVDKALLTRCEQLDVFGLSQVLRPLPLLGVPGWHTPQDAAFYQNTDYFRPARAGLQPTPQLPL